MDNLLIIGGINFKNKKYKYMLQYNIDKGW
ncbi:hypothetical protein Halha_1376 [Halobacteroides halobius DSM 5150]|uniref:Uncharacterized protein n=1 Tax=Halobacteroides halobius (strain ATCC 35273 / DSM 5150 / MD-1) TaxID=748449 RepID=L0K8J8_HALHC|nr:hypothetical protein Halha_1376 [Halobacteroides halobius DSM 5150]